MEDARQISIPIMNRSKENLRCQQNNILDLSNLPKPTMLEVLKILFVSFFGFLFTLAEAGRGEIFETNNTAGIGQKNYEEQEEDKIVPHR